ncbi:T9SS type A sorting domain-containing protein [Flavivirga algicola]|uniref:T9SS type A sorting domain-containing protein n=2 Tax=Flavivirga algicola TaxID=2729136 RepID=A0ABX1RXR5_9FLAO|nr:T9SS type A sorting domain-containing protein [Flavivirga algicola]NMH88362.1 T9SS type A sorting domain-containing protein [Flavivirga algicola]
MKEKYIYKHLGIVLLFILFNFKISAQADIYIAVNGNDSNSGDINQPLKTLIAARDKARSTGAKTIWIREGRYYYDQTINLNASDNGLKISGYQDEKVIFDGGITINPNKFSKVTTNLDGRIKTEVVNKVYSTTITDSDLSNLLNLRFMNISIDDEMIRLSRFPNEGLALIDKNNTLELSETPGATGTASNPKGAGFKLDNHFSFNSDAWEAEIIRNGKIDFWGNISADWVREKINPLATVKFNGDHIRGIHGTRYGIDSHHSPPRVHFTNILYELDMPGEWYFDDIDNILYIYPYKNITPQNTISVWGGSMLVTMSGVEDITIERMTIQHLAKGSGGDGAINVRDNSSNVHINGITFRYIADPLTAVNIFNGTNNSVQSCDFFDVSGGGRLYGGSYNNNSIDKANNSWENCHFTQIYSKDYLGKVVGITGAGNVFRNNLAHNINGQPFTYSGVEHLIEKNEVFNAQIEEGDGGFFYTAHELGGFGSIFRHNFLHHNMHIKGVVLKGGVHSDGGDAGEIITENVFYRMGAGTKNSWAGGGKNQRNIYISCNLGAWDTPRDITDPRFSDQYNIYMDRMEDDPLNPNATRNVFGAMLQKIGIPNWQNGITRNNWRSRIDPWWENRYPSMTVMFDAYFLHKRMGTYGYDFTDNFFYETEDRDIVTNAAPNVSNNQQIAMNAFTDFSTLDFSYSGSQPNDAPNIPFNDIGLYLDTYRCAVPDKAAYRKDVKDYFANRKIRGESFTSATFKDYFYNTGKVVLATVPCTGAIVETGDDSYTVKATGETCLDKGNGQIRIQAKGSGSYVANLDGGSDINFTSDWLIENLAAGPYELCITNTASGSIQCYGLEIEAGTSVTGKTTSGSGKVAVNISEGTAPFDVYVNSAKVLRTSSPAFSVDASYGDVVEVKTSVACEGVLSKTMNGIVSVSPNPTEGGLSIALPAPLKNVTVSVYNVYSQLVSSGSYPVSDGRVGLEINGAPAGIYFASIEMGDGRPKVLKIIKK